MVRNESAMGSAEQSVSRRSFLAGAAAFAGLAAGSALAGCSSGNTATEAKAEAPVDEAPADGAPAAESAKPSWMPESWDDECDVLVVGAGAAGLAAAIAAMQKGAAVTVLEAAPEEDAGGSTRVSGDMLMIPDDAEKAIEYQTNLNAGYKVSDSMMKAWAKGLMDNMTWLEDEVGYDLQQGTAASPEFPDIPGGEAIKTYYVDGICGLSSLWIPMNDTVQEMGANMCYNARAVKLIYHPETKEVYGVETEDGRKFKAGKGVVLACGGFENNPEMIQNYFPCLGTSECVFLGSPYNRGDGITMAQAIGAKLWHMNSYAGVGVALRSQSLDSGVAGIPNFSAKDYIYVNGEGSRFMLEERARLTRHGKLKDDGAWPLVTVPGPAWAIFGPQAFAGDPITKPVEWMSWGTMMGGNAADTNQGMVDAGVYLKADTIEELAEKLGYDPTVLAKTINDYNAAVEAGEPEFLRARRGHHRQLRVQRFVHPLEGPVGVPDRIQHRGNRRVAGIRANHHRASLLCGFDFARSAQLPGWSRAQRELPDARRLWQPDSPPVQRW